MSEPRQHHFVPKGYLALFTPSGKVHDRLWVLDQTTGRQWKALPEAIAHQRDLYRIQAEGLSPNTVERWFSAFEAKAVPVLRSIDENRELPTGGAMETLLAFVALQSSRTHRLRNTFGSAMSELAKMSLRLTLASKERWETTKANMKRDGVAGPQMDEVTFEEMREFVDRDDVTISPGESYLTRIQVEGWETLIPMLRARSWKLVIAPKGEAFICSDEPVALVSQVPLPPIYGPGFGMLNTEVTMPISKSVMLIGRFKDTSGVFLTDRHGVAVFNSRTGMYAPRWVFSPFRDFLYYTHEQKVGTTSDLIRVIKEKGRQHDSES